jgi:uncharacterized protein YgiM (DUF1202 family)
MASFHEVAHRLREAETPLSESYRELRAAAATRLEQELSAQLVEIQKTQLAYLQLMEEGLPHKFLALGSICSQGTKLRAGPGGSHPVVAELDIGAPAVVMDWNGHWAQVQVSGGQQGFVFRDYVRVEGAAREVPSWQRSG